MSLETLHADVARYYTRKIEAHGPTPAGADWVSEPTQQLRFVQLLKVCGARGAFSLNDVGCGYGALRGFLDERFPRVRIDYLGIDLSPAMLAQAQRLWADRDDATFHLGADLPRRADFSVASGIFNVKLDHAIPEWEAGIAHTLRTMWAGSRRGMAVNFLAPLAPGVHGTPQLYRCEPERWRGFVETELDAQAHVLADYGMREFTLLATHRAARAA